MPAPELAWPVRQTIITVSRESRFWRPNAPFTHVLKEERASKSVYTRLAAPAHSRLWHPGRNLRRCSVPPCQLGGAGMDANQRQRWCRLAHNGAPTMHTSPTALERLSPPIVLRRIQAPCVPAPGSGCVVPARHLQDNVQRLKCNLTGCCDPKPSSHFSRRHRISQRNTAKCGCLRLMQMMQTGGCNRCKHSGACSSLGKVCFRRGVRSPGRLIANKPSLVPCLCGARHRCCDRNGAPANHISEVAMTMGAAGSNYHSHRSRPSVTAVYAGPKSRDLATARNAGVREDRSCRKQISSYPRSRRANCP